MSDRLRRIDWFLVVIILLITSFHVWGVRRVPFHPDETSLLYQSADLEAWLDDPLSLAWDASRAGDYDMQYRALNPPLPKIILGIGRRLAGFGPEAVAVDWDWSKSWDENRDAGALPVEALLISARMANVLLLPISLLLVYLSGVKIGGRLTGILAVVLLGSNALVLLHARRAMAEASLIFGISLAIYGFIHAQDKPWLAGLGAATALLSKLSAAALAPVGLALVVWPSKAGSRKLRMAGSRALVYLAALLGEVLIFDPLLWRHPFQAIGAVWRARLEFSAAQVTQFAALAPATILSSPRARLASLIGNTFLERPQFAEVGNYLTQTAAQVQAYLAQPGNALLRGVIGGGLMLAICMLGIAVAAIRFRRMPAALGFSIGALGLASAAQAVALYVAIPVPFQRYYIPLVPFVCLWAAYGLSGPGSLLADEMRGLFRREAAPSN